MAKKLLSFDGGSILGIQGLRNSLSAATFYAGTSSTVAFILVQLSLTSKGLIWIQQAILIGILFFGFANWLTVIKSFDHGTALFASEEMFKEPTETELANRDMHIRLTTNVLQKGQIHYFIGMRAWYASMICAGWIMSTESSIATLFICIVVIVWMYFQDHQYQAIHIKIKHNNGKGKEAEKQEDTDVHSLDPLMFRTFIFLHIVWIWWESRRLLSLYGLLY